MKKLILTILTLFLMFGVVWAEPAEIKCPSVYEGTIAASATDDSDVVELIRQTGYEGFFSVQPVGTFTGTLKIDYRLSNDGITWSPAVEIVADATSGTVYPYPATGVNVFAGFQKLVLTETGTSDEVIITGLFRCIQ